MGKVFIIAEAGVNHNGDFNIAKKMVDAAKEAGVDAIKFQTFKADKLVTRNAAKANYQKETTGTDESQYNMLKKLELTYDEFIQLKEYCDQKKIHFMSTAFDLGSVDFLSTLDMKYFKIPSGEITNLPYLKKIAQLNKPMIISTGMCDDETLDKVIHFVEQYNKNLSILHCTTEYPTPMRDVNLLAMNHLKQRYGYPVGLSDHTVGYEADIAAVALGATIIEKHFTLDRKMVGPDHKASLEPNELKKMVSAIRNIEIALGQEYKEMSSIELENAKVARKSIVAKEPISKGELLTENNLTTKRPGTGISPLKWYDIIGTKAIKDFQPDEEIEI